MTTPTTMRAILPIHDGYNTGEPIGLDWSDLSRFAALRETPVPEPGAGQVLIRVARAAVNPSDLHYLAGEYGLPRRADAAAGFEGTGTVVGGQGLYARWLTGKRVAFAAGPTGTGTWAEYAVADAATAIPVGGRIRNEDAASLLVNPFTAWAMVDDAIRHHRPRAKDGRMPAVILTAGASQLSRLALALARERGLPAIAVVRRPEQRAMLLAEGADTVLVTTEADYESQRDEAVRRLRPLTVLDAVCDTVSSDLAALLGSGGRWVVYGGLGGERPPGLSPLDAIFRNKRQEGFWLSTWLQRAPIARRLRCVRDVRARFADGRWTTTVAAAVPLENAMADLLPAPRRDEAGEGGKVQIVMPAA